MLLIDKKVLIINLQNHNKTIYLNQICNNLLKYYRFVCMNNREKDTVLIEGEDFYYTPEGYKCFTEKHHLKRGYCCKSNCRHCPYGYDPKTGRTKK